MRHFDTVKRALCSAYGQRDIVGAARQSSVHINNLGAAGFQDWLIALATLL